MVVVCFKQIGNQALSSDTEGGVFDAGTTSTTTVPVLYFTVPCALTVTCVQPRRLRMSSCGFMCPVYCALSTYGYAYLPAVTCMFACPTRAYAGNVLLGNVLLSYSATVTLRV